MSALDPKRAELRADELLETQVEADATVVRFLRPALIDPLVVEAVGKGLLALQEAQPKQALIVDFSGCNGLSSAMVGKLITLHRRARKNGAPLVLCCMGPIVREVFQSARLDEYFVTVRTLPEAVLRTQEAPPTAG